MTDRHKEKDTKIFFTTQHFMELQRWIRTLRLSGLEREIVIAHFAAKLLAHNHRFRVDLFIEGYKPRVRKSK